MIHTYSSGKVSFTCGQSELYARLSFTFCILLFESAKIVVCVCVKQLSLPLDFHLFTVILGDSRTATELPCSNYLKSIFLLDKSKLHSTEQSSKNTFNT